MGETGAGWRLEETSAQFRQYQSILLHPQIHKGKPSPQSTQTLVTPLLLRQGRINED